MRPTRVALIGGFGTGNFGNDASLDAALHLLRGCAPNATVESICDDPKIVASRFGLRAFRLAYRPRRFVRLLDNLLLRFPSGAANWLYSLWLVGRYDIIVWAGTGVFDDYRTGPLGFPAQVFRWSVAARLRRTRVACLSVGAGPIVNPLSRFFLKSAALCANARSYRDAGSRDFMQSIGLDEAKSEVFPDLVFTADVRPQGALPHEPIKIGLGVMAYRGWRRDASIEASYAHKLEQFVEHAMKRGYQLEYLVAEPSDKRALANLQRSVVGADSFRRAELMETLNDVMASVASCHVVIGSRFHVLIAALKMRRPCVSISYGPKHDLLLAAAGIPEFCQPADHFDVDQLVSDVEKILARLPHYERIVEMNVTGFEKQSEAISAFLVRELGARAKANAR
jgi:polysaccharide pyruvyl transferase WcaK-like protein